MTSLVRRAFLGRNHPVTRSHRIVHELKVRGIHVDDNQRALIRLLSDIVHSSGNNKQDSGCYVYGPPGRGKSMILDALFASLDPEETARFHFHDFFHSIQRSFQPSHGGSMGSVFLSGLERELDGITTLCFDEFHCVEPGDAMFMARLVGYCQQHGITLITTSNYEPERLLDDPYFHHLIEPTIEKLRRDFHVFELDNALDYRTVHGSLRDLGGYSSGTLNIALTPPPTTLPAQTLQVGPDALHPVYPEDGTLRISFELLCQTRRNTRDYLEMAARFYEWTIEQIPASSTMPLDEQRRFANLLDVLYDRDVRLHLYAADDLTLLGSDLPEIEQQRLASRLAQLSRRTERKQLQH